MEDIGIQQYLEDGLKEGSTPSEIIDKIFIDFYMIFCNSLQRFSYEKDEDDALLLESEVLAKIEQIFKRKSPI